MYTPSKFQMHPRTERGMRAADKRMHVRMFHCSRQSVKFARVLWGPLRLPRTCLVSSSHHVVLILLFNFDIFYSKWKQCRSNNI